MPADGTEVRNEYLKKKTATPRRDQQEVSYNASSCSLYCISGLPWPTPNHRTVGTSPSTGTTSLEFATPVLQDSSLQMCKSKFDLHNIYSLKVFLVSDRLTTVQGRLVFKFYGHDCEY